MLILNPVIKKLTSSIGFDLFKSGYLSVQKLKGSITHLCGDFCSWEAKGVVLHEAWPHFFLWAALELIPLKHWWFLASTAPLVDLAQIKHNVGVLILARVCVKEEAAPVTRGEEQCVQYVFPYACICECRRISLAAAKRILRRGHPPFQAFRFLTPTPSRTPPRPHWFCLLGMGCSSRAELTDCSPVCLAKASSAVNVLKVCLHTVFLFVLSFRALICVSAHISEGVLTPCSAQWEEENEEMTVIFVTKCANSLTPGPSYCFSATQWSKAMWRVFSLGKSDIDMNSQSAFMHVLDCWRIQYIFSFEFGKSRVRSHYSSLICVISLIVSLEKHICTSILT